MFHKEKAFYLLVVTQTLSLIGSRLTGVGLGIWVFQTTGSATPLLLTAFFNELPAMLGGSIAGVFIDRWDRRIVMILSDAGQALGSFLLLISVLTGRFELWQLYSISFLQGLFSVFQQPAEDASITMLVADSQRDRANAIRQMAFPLAGVFSMALAGILYVTVGIEGLILIDLLTFFLALVGLLFVSIPAPPITEISTISVDSLLKEWLQGAAFLWQRKQLLVFLLYMLLINFLLNGPLSLDIPFLLLRTGSEKLSGYLMAVMSLGALLGAMIIAAHGKVKRRVLTLLLGMLITGAMFLLFATTSSIWIMAFALLLLMIPLPISNTLMISLLQRKTPPQMQGRIFSIYGQMSYFGSTISFLLTGRLVDHWLEPLVLTEAWHPWQVLVGSSPGAGMGLLIFFSGVIILILTASMFFMRPIRRMEEGLIDYE